MKPTERRIEGGKRRKGEDWGGQVDSEEHDGSEKSEREKTQGKKEKRVGGGR